jgi:hypothetical protein
MAEAKIVEEKEHTRTWEIDLNSPDGKILDCIVLKRGDEGRYTISAKFVEVPIVTSIMYYDASKPLPEEPYPHMTIVRASKKDLFSPPKREFILLRSDQFKYPYIVTFIRPKDCVTLADIADPYDSVWIYRVATEEEVAMCHGVVEK